MKISHHALKINTKSLSQFANFDGYEEGEKDMIVETLFFHQAKKAQSF